MRWQELLRGAAQEAGSEAIALEGAIGSASLVRGGIRGFCLMYRGWLLAFADFSP